MTREETKALMARLRAAYPAFCRGIEGDDLRRVVDLWADMLAGQSAAFIGEGARAHIETCRFAPTIAELLEAARQAEAKKGGDILGLF